MNKITLNQKIDLLTQLNNHGLYNEGKPLRLHLGCGQQYFEGYVNIDYPPSEHTVQTSSVADVFGDITKLDFPQLSIDEIRSHHVFEHFSREISLALLVKWHMWLKIGGKIYIETPDIEASIRQICEQEYSYEQKQSVLRHVFGSHEADWAIHKDGWYSEKFQHVLSALKFEDIKFNHSSWQTTRNITVTAKKLKHTNFKRLSNIAKALLRNDMIDESESEEKLWSIWCHKFDRFFNDENLSTEPEVSIFIPVYNGQKYLAETLESIIGQTFKNFECIIADDGSTDQTLEIARSYQQRDNRIKVISLPHKGEVHTRNMALKNANPNSLYLLNHDSDDISLPTKLERLVKFLEKHPEIGIVGCFAEYFDDMGNSMGRPDIEYEPNQIRQTFGNVNSMINSASLIRCEVFNKIGNYREEFRSTDDYDFFARALMAGFELANIPEVLHKIRLHQESIGSTRTKKQKILADRIRENYKTNTNVWSNQNNILLNQKSNFGEKSNLQNVKVNGNKLKLHLGCGDIKIPDFINVDINPNAPAVDVVDNVCTLTRFKNNSASIIYACHVLEHFNHHEIIPILKRWREILEPSGELRISVPDIDRIVKIYIKNWQHFQTPPNTPWIGLLYGGQIDKYDFHKTGFNFTYLKYLLEKAGFKNISEYPHEPHWLGIKDASLANQPFHEYLSLNIKATKVKIPNNKKQYHQPQKSLNILHTVQLYNPHVGGAELVVQQLSERLAKRGHNVTVATTKLPERTFHQLNGVQIEQFDVWGNAAVGLTGSDIDHYKQFLLEHPADIMMNYAAQQWATDLAFDILDPTSNRRINIIAPCGYSALSDIKTLQMSQFKEYFENIIPKVLPKYDAAIYHSGQYQDYEFALSHGFKNSIIIPNGVCEEEFLNPPKLSFRKKFNITTKYMGLCVANFFKGKGQDKIIECLRQMNRPDFTMVFIGKEGNELSNIYRLASKLNVKFCVGIEREETLAAFHEADIFLFGSEKECSPLVILEAKASRTPFVSTNCGNVIEWKGGITCAPEKIAFYANKILDDELIRKNLAEEGWKEWKEKLTWESVTDKYEQLYLQFYQKKFALNTNNKNQIINPKILPASLNENFENTKNTLAIIFSKDRAMQLHATIESFLLHCKDKQNIDINVLYKTSSILHSEQYEQLRLKFPEINFIKEVDFRHQTLSLIEKNEYVLFLVDDNIFVRPFSVQQITRILQKEKDAIGFSLRIGKNTTYCYPLSSPQKLPSFTEIDECILKYCWLKEQYDFGYPLELSSSVYRSKDMLQLLRRLDFTNPNSLEGVMNINKNFDQNLRYLLTFKKSMTFCNPINIVQNVSKNKFGTHNNYTSRQLADYFSQGKRIDIDKYIGFTPNAAHQEVELYFKNIDTKEICKTNAEMTYRPEFSIIMANYNNEKYIVEAIESVLNQTFIDWELIIVEDCSTDNSIEIIKRYLNDKRIRLIQHEKNKGYIAALKTGIANVKSKYFGIFDSDDFLVDTAIEIMYDEHIQNTDCGLIYSQYVKCNQDLKPREIGHCRKIPQGKTNLETNLVSHFKTFKLHDYLKTSGYDEDILYAEDRDIAYKMEEVTNLLFVDKCLYLYRELSNSQGHDPRKRFIGMQTRQQAIKNSIKRRIGSCPDKLPQAILQQIKTSHTESSIPQGITNKLENTFEQSPIFTNTPEPKVSIIMPAYNAADYIQEAIESVLCQSYRNFELIIINDGSTDNTKNIIASFKDNRIKYFYQKNKGLAGTHNSGIKKAQGLFLTKLDSDDLITPDFITRHIQEFEKHPEADLVYCDDYLIDENSKPIRVIKRPEYTDRKTLIRDLFHYAFPVVPFRTCIRKSVFDKIGFFDENLPIAEDYDMIRRFVKHGLKIQHLPSALYLRRMTSDSLSRSLSTKKAKWHFEVIKRFVDTFNYDELFPDVDWEQIPPHLRLLHAKCLIAGTYLAIGQEYVKSKAFEYSKTAFDQACSELNECVKMDPENPDLQKLYQKSQLIRTRYNRTPQKVLF